MKDSTCYGRKNVAGNLSRQTISFTKTKISCCSLYSLNVIANNSHNTPAKRISIIPTAISINMKKQFFSDSTELYNLNGSFVRFKISNLAKR